MLVHEAKALARQWVLHEGEKLPGFQGAFFHGSINWLAADATLAPTSDLDIMLVFADPPPTKLGKFVYNGVILEVSSLASSALASPEAILSTSHLAGSFQGSSIIADPTGELTHLQQAVAANYAKRAWVIKRCADAEAKIRRNLAGIRKDDPFHDQVMAWLFGTGVTTHVLLIAGLENPTVRRRYLAVRELLANYGRLDFYEELLRLLGCRTLRPQQVAGHLATLTAAFDVAKTVVTTAYPFAADLTDLARPIAIEGSRELIEQGYHREAIFWIVATYARCQQVFDQAGTPEQLATFTPGFQALLADLGIACHGDLVQRRNQVIAFLPRLWTMAEAIIAANPAITSE